MTTWWGGIDELDDDQRAVVGLPADGRFLITGPPGSGKTNLLLLRASYLHRAGRPNFVLLSFTNALRDFLSAGRLSYAVFPDDRVETSIGWMMRRIREVGGDLDDLPDGFEERRVALGRRLAGAMDAGNYGPIHDTILLDEAQDYTREEIMLFERCARNLFIVGDDRQQIYRGDGEALVAAQGIIDPKNRVNLKYHYRSAPEICEVADRFAKANRGHRPIKPTSNYKETPGRVRIERSEQAGQFELVIERLRLQRDSFPDEPLGVLFPKAEVLDAFWSVLQATDLADLSMNVREDGIPDPSKQIYCSTIHSAKGLEFRAVHLPRFELLKRLEHQRNVAYTAVTRAKTALDIYHEEDFGGWLAEALQPEDETPDDPQIADLFRKKT